MQLPIVAPAPLVSEHRQVFRDLFCDERQFQHLQNYLTGRLVLENKSLANISRCILDSADKTNLSCFLSTAPWSPSAVNERRVEYLLAQTVNLRRAAKDSCLIVDDTLCEHVGSLIEYVDRHYNHSDNTYPLAHNLVTSHYLSGAVRFPVGYEWYRRYAAVTRWPEFMAQSFPEQVIPTQAKARQKLHRQFDQPWQQDPEFAQLYEQFRSKIDWAKVLLEPAIKLGLPFQTVLMDSWYLAPELVEKLTELKKDWVSLLKRKRNLEVHSFQLQDAQGQPIPLPGTQIKVEDLVPLIPANAYRKIQLDEQTYWCFTFCVRISGLGKVRLVISFDNPELHGTYAVLITNRTNWSARQILEQYLNRWPIETFYRDGKQLLGLGDDRMRSFEAIQTHWCLVFVAYSILHLACLPPPSSKGQGKPPLRPSQSIGEICRQQGQLLIQKLILFAHDQIQQGQPVAQVFNFLFAKQQPGVMI
jgi:DDE superfamily endonuclease